MPQRDNLKLFILAFPGLVKSAIIAMLRLIPIILHSLFACINRTLHTMMRCISFIPRTLRKENALIACHKENEKLGDAWIAAMSSRAVFVAIKEHITPTNEHIVIDASLSWWSPANVSGPKTYFWMLTDSGVDTDLLETPSQDIFFPDVPRKIKTHELPTYISDIMEDLISSFRRIYLINYGTNKINKILENTQCALENMTVVDIQKVWQSQHQSTRELSFEQCVQEALLPSIYHPTLGDTRGYTRAVIELLRLYCKHAVISRELRTGNPSGLSD